MAMMGKEDLRKLFQLNQQHPSDTHDYLKCERCPKPPPPLAEGEAEAAAAAGASGALGY